MTKIVYKYDARTGEYIGIHSCQKNPVRVGAYLVPLHTTEITPPDTESGYVVVFNGSEWGQVVDHRGAKVFCTETKNELGIVQEVDFTLTDGQTFLEPPEAEDGKAVQWDGENWTQVADHRGETVYSTIDGTAFFIDEIGDYPDGYTKDHKPSGYHVWNADINAWEFDNQYLWDVARVQRDALLTACDWTMVPDAPTDKAAWTVYRQALRDLPDNQAEVETLDDIIWPTSPDQQ